MKHFLFIGKFRGEVMLKTIKWKLFVDFRIFNYLIIKIQSSDQHDATEYALVIK